MNPIQIQPVYSQKINTTPEPTQTKKRNQVPVPTAKNFHYKKKKTNPYKMENKNKIIILLL